MARLSEAKVKERIRRHLPRIAKVVEQKQQRGITEDDTATIVQAVLREALGYDIFEHLTKEYRIKGHYADIAVRDGDSLWYFIEVKALGSKLQENHLFQVVSYSVQDGLPWAVLTDGNVWQCYRVAKVRGAEPFWEVVISDTSQPISEKAELLYMLSREGFRRGLLDERWAKAQCFRPLNLAQVVLSEDVVRKIRTVLRREHPGRSIDMDDLRGALIRGVIRGDLGEDLSKLPKSTRARRVRKPRATVAPGPEPAEAPEATGADEAPEG